MDIVFICRRLQIPIGIPRAVGTINLTIPRIICPGDALLPLSVKGLDIPTSIPIRVMHTYLEEHLSPISGPLEIACIISTNEQTLFLPDCSLANRSFQRQPRFDFVTGQRGIIVLAVSTCSLCSSKVKDKILPHAILKKSVLPSHFVIFPPSSFSLQFYTQTTKHPRYRCTDLTSPIKQSFERNCWLEYTKITKINLFKRNMWWSSSYLPTD